MSTPAPTPSPSAQAGTVSLADIQSLLSQSASNVSGQQQAVTPGLGVTKAEQNTYRVFMGHGNATSGGAYSEQVPSAAGPNRQAIVMSADEAAADIYKWDPSKLTEWSNHLIKAGIIKPGQYTFQDLVSLWGDATDQAGKLHTLGGKNMTPWDVVDMNAEITGSKGGSPTSNTQKATSINEVDPATARTALDQTYSSLLGRMPNNAEREAFASKVLQASKTMPSVTTSTTTTSGKPPATGQSVLQTSGTSTSDTSGGFGADALSNAATDQAKASPEYGSHQAATTAYNWLTAAIRGGGA